MSGGNVTIAQFNTTTTAPVAGDSFAAYQTSASQTVQFLATQVSKGVFAQTATAITMASGAVISSAGNYTLGGGIALATTATVGYVMITSCAGAPSGVPVGFGSGNMPIQYDTTNNKLWVYAASGAWRGVALT